MRLLKVFANVLFKDRRCKGPKRLTFFDSIVSFLPPASATSTLPSAVSRIDFNSYGSRRGNHQVMMRGTFANIRIRNQMVPGVEGGVTIHFPSLEQLMEDDEWRRGGCGYDSTQADEYITNTRNDQGLLTPSYNATLSLRRLFRPGRLTLRLRRSHPAFSSSIPTMAMACWG